MLFLFTYPGIFGALCFTLSRSYDAPECEAVSGEARGEAQEGLPEENREEQPVPFLECLPLSRFLRSLIYQLLKAARQSA